MPHTLKKRFDSKTSKGRKCWAWLGHFDKNGYGKIRVGKTSLGAHRASWMLYYGDIPKDLCVLHKCDVPSCVNPKHLFLGTRAENNKDRHMKGRNADKRGEKNSKSKLTEKNVALIKKLYTTGDYKQAALAARFGVGQSAISRVVTNLRWGHLTNRL